MSLALWGAGLAAAAAQGTASDQPSPVGEVMVIGATPLPGAGVAIAKAPYEVRSLSAAELAPGDLAGGAGTLTARVGAISVNDNLGDAFQPDLLYRGFTASPVLGTPQGLAVYQNGVRINEAFGDTVNWDLIPGDAIARIDVVGTNPVYGLNALGGAVVVGMKTGFDAPGGDLEVSGGAFGRRAVGLTLGGRSDHFAGFVAIRGLDQDGWRLTGPDHLRQLYAMLSARTGRLTLDLSYTAADNALHGASASPVQELAVDRRLFFTSPQANQDRLNFFTLTGTWRANPVLSFQSNAYLRDFRQSVANGNTTGYVPCANPAETAFLCQPGAATPLTSTTGAPIADISAGGALPIGENDRESLHALTFGGALQATLAAGLLGHGNQLSVGVSGDSARIDYGSSAEVGVIDAGLVVRPSGFVVATAEGGPFTATPVRLRANDTDLGAFATDTLDLTARLSLTASGRFNQVRIALRDRQGSSLSGVNSYQRVNPAIGAAYRFAGVTAYAGYAEGSRAPTASEIECSDPQAPCLLPSSLSADPPNLRQVVSRTLEAGVRGSARLGRGRLSYSLGVYRTEVRDDIYAVATSISAGYFQNIHGTRRQGGQIDLGYRDDRLTAYASYAHVEAVFDADVLLPSPSNPFRDANGDIQVRRGDPLPGIPRDRLKLGAEYQLTGSLSVGGELQALSGQTYRGDEANLLAPLPGYAVLGLHARYEVNARLQLFVRVENALDARYATFGVLGDPTGVGAAGVPAAGAGVDPRFQSPAPPAAVYGGVRLTF